MALLSLNKLMGLASMGTLAADIALLKRFLSGIAVVIALTAISSTMAGVLVIAGFYGLYVWLAHYGLDARAAAFTVSSLAILVTIGLGVFARIRWRQLREIPRFVPVEAPLSHIGRVADAFIDGLLERTRPR